jgi:hypothetical protein
VGADRGKKKGRASNAFGKEIEARTREWGKGRLSPVGGALHVLYGTSFGISKPRPSLGTLA